MHARTYPHLSTVAKSIPNLGRSAVNLLLKRISDPDGPADHVYLDTHLEFRGSCGCGTAAGEIGDYLDQRVQTAPELIAPISFRKLPANSACT